MNTIEIILSVIGFIFIVLIGFGLLFVVLGILTFFGNKKTGS